MITPSDIANPSRKSGYDHVNSTGGAGPNTHGGGGLWRAECGPKGRGPRTSKDWRGPRRTSALEAAQDYCDHMNGIGATPATPLRSAGHNGRRTRIERTPEVEHALGVLRDAKAEKQGKQGFVYLVVEWPRGRSAPSLRYGKIGYSTNPEARVGELQEGNPRPLCLYAYMPGTRAAEKALHEKHLEQNELQEWFRLTREILLEWDLSHIVKNMRRAAA